MYLAMKQDWPYKHFKISEMECKCSCGLLPRDSFMELLEKIREELGSSMIVNSGARCESYNKSIGSTSIAHSIGAADISCYGDKAYKLAKIAFSMGMSGKGIKQESATRLLGRYIHLDNIATDEYISTPRPRLWSY